MRPNVFLGKYKSGHAYLTGLIPEDCDGFRGADVADPLSDVRIVAYWGGGGSPIRLHVEEDVEAHLDQAGSQISDLK